MNIGKAITAINAGRALRAAMILNCLKHNSLSKEEAQELLHGPLVPDEPNTIIDDSFLLDISIEDAEGIIAKWIRP